MVTNDTKSEHALDRRAESDHGNRRIGKILFAFPRRSSGALNNVEGQDGTSASAVSFVVVGLRDRTQWMRD
jgi:hypothetical protein